ncbi:hypothetical protein CGK32_21765 [Vibrio parahaemolyticus]|uniref:hypothetical protein n=1 Tax=Vibrio parahaemolyticus TaxID=670 RepID=UPI00112486E0|nr:hypothetical protein [Vibrio parahaemolyticus]TOA19557.1 hypothetical protein CGK32_21765 [Vibrio parahaemolyticus]
MNNNNKTEKYLDLLMDVKRLKKSSRRMVRKAKSPLARSIEKGNVNAIKKAARDKVFGVLTKKQRGDLCQILCLMKRKIKNSVPGQKTRDIVSWAITAIIGIIDAASGIVISLLWVIRENIDSVICSCKLDHSCSGNGCVAV